MVDVHLDSKFTVLNAKADTEQQDGQETDGEHQDGPESGTE
jgi:hypothetical protein